MNNYRKLTDDIKKELVASLLSTTTVADIIAKTKEMSDEDSGTFSVVCSTADRDRQNEIVMQDGWDLSFYKLNPVVLWAHDYSSMPIGVCTSIEVVNGQLLAKGKFAPADANPFAQNVRKLYDLGMVKTVSVGFIPTEYDANDRDVITKAQLLEFSFVPVPANPYALSTLQVTQLGLDLTMLKTKGLEFNVKAAQVGEVCQGDDGTPGVLAKNPTDPDGPMVCIPSKSMAVKESMRKLDESIAAFKVNHTKSHAMHQENHAKAIDALKDAIKDADPAVKDAAFEAHHKYALVENQRHSKEMDTHCECVNKAIECFKDAVTDAMKDYPSGDGTGDDAGANPTADSVRMMKAIADAYSKLSEVCTALKDYAESEGGKKTGEPDDVQPAAPKVETPPADPVPSEVEKFLRDRELVRTISNALGKVLRAYNHKDRTSK